MKSFIPFSVGGGIRTLSDMRDVLLAGAEKVSVNSAAILNPEIIRRRRPWPSVPSASCWEWM